MQVVHETKGPVCEYDSSCGKHGVVVFEGKLVCWEHYKMVNPSAFIGLDP